MDDKEGHPQDGLWKRYKWLLISVGGFLVVVLVTAWAFGITGNEQTTSLAQIADGEAGSVASGESVLVTGPDGRVIPASDANGGASGTSGSGDSGTSDGSGAPESFPPGDPGDGDAPGTEQPPPAPPGAVMAVRVMFWNDTGSNSPKGCEIIIDGETWTPDADSASDSDTMGGLAYDEVLELVVLPNGPGGDRFEVPVEFTSVMDPGSDRDAIHVEISDGQVRVIGNAVENFDVTFERS